MQGQTDGLMRLRRLTKDAVVAENTVNVQGTKPASVAGAREWHREQPRKVAAHLQNEQSGVTVASQYRVLGPMTASILRVILNGWTLAVAWPGGLSEHGDCALSTWCWARW